MIDITTIILFLVGLAVGSFSNVFLLRYNPEKDRFFSFSRTRGRSHCPHCKAKLRWFELVPLLSFIIQQGRCRSCKKLISWQYPLVELSGGLIFAGVPMVLHRFFFFWNPSWAGLFVLFSILWIAVLMCLVLAFVVDVKYYIIPNSLNAVIFGLGALWVLIGDKVGTFTTLYGGSFLRQYKAILPSFSGVWENHLLGMAVGALFFFLIVLFSRGRAMGMGDVKLIGALGLLFGWPDIVFIIALSFIIGALYSLVLVAGRKKVMADRVPFGPFIVIATFCIFFAGAGLLGAYFGIIGV